MKKETYIPTLLITVLLGFCMEVQAALLFYEGFDYGTSDASLTSVSDWTATATDNDAKYVSTGLSYGSLTVSGGMAQTATSWGAGNRNYILDIPDIDISSESEVWVSMLLQVTTETISSGSLTNFGISLQRNSWAVYQNYGAGKAWSNTTALTSSFLGSITGAEYSTIGTETVLLAYRFQPGYSGELWLNPALGGAPPTPGTGQTLTDGGSLLTSIQNLYLGYRVLPQNMDELRIGTTFSDIAPIPEPGALSLVAIAGCVFLVSRRFRRAHRC